MSADTTELVTVEAGPLRPEAVARLLDYLDDEAAFWRERRQVAGLSAIADGRLGAIANVRARIVLEQGA